MIYIAQNYEASQAKGILIIIIITIIIIIIN